MNYEPDPYNTVEPKPYVEVPLPTPARLDECCGYKMAFRYASYHPWRHGTGGHFLEYWEDGEVTECIWEVDDLAEAKRTLKDLEPEDLGYTEEVQS